jgi:hypothetical protein
MPQLPIVLRISSGLPNIVKKHWPFGRSPCLRHVVALHSPDIPFASIPSSRPSSPYLQLVSTGTFVRFLS